jgi:hypothetical protein
LQAQGYLVKKVRAIWGANGFSGHALIEFGSTLDDAKSAFKLERKFYNAGKDKTYFLLNSGRREGPYLWVFRSNDTEYFYGRPFDHTSIHYGNVMEANWEADHDANDPYEWIKNQLQARLS